MTDVSKVDGRMLTEDNPRPGFKAGYRPQHKKQGTNKYEDTEGSDGALHVKKVDGNGNALGEFYGYSNETKPTNVNKGSSYMEFDTLDVYLFDGMKWVIT